MFKQIPYIALAAAFSFMTGVSVSEEKDYNQIGQDMAREAFGNTSKPGTVNGGFNFVISNPDGSTTWDTNLGNGPDGHSEDPDDLEYYSSSYGNENAVTVNSSTNQSEAYEEVREVNAAGGHAYFGNDPAMVHMETSMNQLEPDLQDIFNGCKEIKSTGKPPQETTSNACYHFEAPVEDGCEMEQKVSINPTNRTPTAVSIMVDKSGSMNTENRIGAARYAALRVAQLLELAENTEYAVYAYPREEGDPDANLDMTVSYPLTNINESVYEPEVEARYSALTANGPTTPFASAAEEAARELMRRTEERKIVLVVTDGQPTGDNFCPTADPCQMSQVIALYPEVDFVAVGIKSTSVATHFDTYRIINDNKELASAMYDLLAVELDAYEAKNIWTNPPCVETALAIEAGDVEGNFVCDAPPDSAGCSNIDGLYICEGSAFAEDFENPFQTISDVCAAASLDSVDYCFIDENGIDRCKSDPPSDDFQNCETYEQEPSCGRVESTCVESSRTSNGICYVFDEVYDCEVDSAPAAEAVETSSDDGSGTITCDEQEVQCTDDDCLGIPDEQNEDFGMATAMIKMAEEIALDSGDCDWEQPDDCRIFEGEAMYCKYHAAWGLRDCCEDTADGSPLEFAAYAYSAYESYAASSAASTALGAFASGVMAAYAIYMAANVAIDMAADCDEDDQIIYNTKRDKLKACVADLKTTRHGKNFYGEYKEKKTWGCCFSSPLARIIQEQVREHIGRPFIDGSGNLDCRGFTLEEFQMIRWGEIDWSEWIDIMYEQNRIPENADLDERYDMTPHQQDDIDEQSAVTDSEEQMQDNHQQTWEAQGN